VLPLCVSLVDTLTTVPIFGGYTYHCAYLWWIALDTLTTVRIFGGYTYLCAHIKWVHLPLCLSLVGTLTTVPIFLSLSLQISEALDVQQKKVPALNHVFAELDYWRDRAGAMSGLHEQLRNPRVDSFIVFFSVFDPSLKMLAQDIG